MSEPSRMEVERRFAAIQELLDRDTLANPDWFRARSELAALAQRSLEADETFLASWHPEGGWEAVTSQGEHVGQDAVSAAGSLTVLETVRADEREVLRVEGSGEVLDSDSIRAHELGSFLGVPIFWWDVAGAMPVRRFGGCLYAHRTTGKAPFSRLDVDVARDLVRIAQPTLNVLRYLKDIEVDLEATQQEVRELRKRAAPEASLSSFRTRVPWVRDKIVEPLRRVVHNDRVTLLILGPTGSGKTHLARAYHGACPRSDKPFVVLDCGSITSSETLGAELFGYAPNSGYANAPQKGSTGKARQADGGTLLIDEIANLSLPLQPRLLRLIEEGRFQPLGGSREERVDIQVIAATNADLERCVEDGTFREDLFHRLNVVRLVLPSLSDRCDDIPELARDLLARIVAAAGRSRLDLDEQALGELTRHDWSAQGNVRGLENFLRRLVWSTDATTVRVDADTVRSLLPGKVRRAPKEPTPNAPAELEEVIAAIREHGSAKKAAEALGRTYRQVYWVLLHAGLRVRDVLDDRG